MTDAKWAELVVEALEAFVAEQHFNFCGGGGHDRLCEQGCAALRAAGRLASKASAAERPPGPAPAAASAGLQEEAARHLKAARLAVRNMYLRRCVGCDKPTWWRDRSGGAPRCLTCTPPGTADSINVCPPELREYLPPYPAEPAAALPEKPSDRAASAGEGALREALGHLAKMVDLADWHVEEIHNIARDSHDPADKARAVRVAADYAAAEKFLKTHRAALAPAQREGE